MTQHDIKPLILNLGHMLDSPEDLLQIACAWSWCPIPRVSDLIGLEWEAFKIFPGYLHVQPEFRTTALGNHHGNSQGAAQGWLQVVDILQRSWQSDSGAFGLFHSLVKIVEKSR